MKNPKNFDIIWDFGMAVLLKEIKKKVSRYLHAVAITLKCHLYLF